MDVERDSSRRLGSPDSVSQSPALKDTPIGEDFLPRWKHEKTLEKIDVEIDSGNFAPLP
jgi:hypothetical protein